MRLESAAKVARRWESWGDAASRSRGGAYDMVCWALVGDMRPVGEFLSLSLFLSEGS